MVRFAGGFAGLDWVFVLEMNREDAKEEAEGLRGGFSYNLILGASLVRQSSPPDPMFA